MNPDKIGIKIPMITKQHWEQLEKLYLPAAIGGQISTEAFQEKIPGFDMDAEKKRKDAKETSDIERITKENEDLKLDLANKEIFGAEKPVPPVPGEE